MEKDNLKERERGKRCVHPFPPAPSVRSVPSSILARLTSFCIVFGGFSDYHELVRNLVAHVKKRDPRVAEHNAKSKEEAAERAVSPVFCSVYQALCFCHLDRRVYD
jgi:hypothetical protein